MKIRIKFSSVRFVLVPGLPDASGAVRFGRRPRHHKTRAFALIELLAVIAVIVLLMAMLIPAMATAQVRSRTQDCLHNQKQLAMAWLAYANDNGDAMIGMGDG